MADEGAKVEESVMLEDYETGGKREVDVLIRGSLGQVPLLVGIEATARAEPADVKWVEAELSKHRAVRTNRLVLVSEAGFTPKARAKALAHNAIPVEPEDLTAEDRVDSIVSQFDSVSPMSVWFTPTAAVAHLIRPSGEKYSAAIYLDTLIITDAGEGLGVVAEELRRCLNGTFPRFLKQIGPAPKRGTGEAIVRFGMPGWTGVPNPENLVVGLRWQPDPDKEPEFHQIEVILVEGKADMKVSEIALIQKKLAERLVAYGKGTMFDSDIDIIVAEDGSGDAGVMRINAPDMKMAG